MKKITIFTLCLTLFLTGSLYSKTVWVSAAGAGAKNGTTEADAYAKESFSAALVDITTADDILRVVGSFAPGSQTLSKTFAYTIEGDAGGSTLNGVTGVGRMFTINGVSVGQNVTFKNITFSGQISSIVGGGAILFSNQAGVTINFENCRFVGNSLTSALAAGGGALFISNSTVNITDCLFKENQALRNGGAISIVVGANVNMTRCTFYANKTTTDNTSGTTGTGGGGAALYVTAGAGAAVVNVDYCTFFQNTTGNTNQDYGTIRSDSGNTTVSNSLFYDNKTNNGAGSPSDWGAASTGTQIFKKSIGQWITSNIDTVESSIVFKRGSAAPFDVAANLASSNLTYDDASGKVKYNVPTVAGENSPIGFVSAGVDAGAWQSGLTLSVNDNEFADDFSVSYNAQTKNLRVIRSNDDLVSLEIYNLIGSKVISRTSASKDENISASDLQSGVYVLVAKGSENKTFAKKFVIN